MKKCLFLICLMISALANAQSIENFVSSPVNPDFEKYLLDENKGAYSLIPVPYDYSFDDLTRLRNGEQLPESFDLRTQTGYNSNPRLLTPRNQGSANTCWGFATMDCLQSIWSKNFVTEYYSVENIVNCHGFVPTKALGGNAAMATAYLTRFAGPVPEVVDQYVSSNSGTCKPVTKTDKVAIVNQVISLPQTDKTLIKQAIQKYGGVFTAVSTECFYTPYYNSTNKAAYIPSTESPTADHAGTIIGWDDNFDKNKFNTANLPANNGAWIVKNSYGTSFGENGYYYLSYEDKIVGTQATVFCGRAEKSGIDTIYYYDKLGRIRSIGNNKDIYALIKYTAPNSQRITEIGTYASSANTTIDIEVYKMKYGNDLYGLIGSSTGNICELPGYYTFTLANPAGVNGDFYVKVKYSTPNPTASLPIEIDEANYAAPEIMSAGYEWFSTTGASWITNSASFSGVVKSFDLCVKVYAQNCNSTLCAPNDNIENAQSLAIGVQEGPFSNVCATAQINEPHPAATGCVTQTGWCADENVVENSLWFTFTAPASGSVNIVTSGLDNQIAVYDALATGTYNDIISGIPSNYAILAANDDATDTEPAAAITGLSGLTPGKTYWLQMDGSFGGITGLAQITITENTLVNIASTSESSFKVINPSKNGILIINNAEEIQAVTLFNLLGNKVSTTLCNGQNLLSINVSNIPAGYYLAKIKTQKGSMTEKINIR